MLSTCNGAENVLASKRLHFVGYIFLNEQEHVQDCFMSERSTPRKPCVTLLSYPRHHLLTPPESDSFCGMHGESASLDKVDKMMFLAVPAPAQQILPTHLHHMSQVPKSSFVNKIILIYS